PPAGCVGWWRGTHGIERRRKRRCRGQPVCPGRTVRGTRRSRDVEHSGPHTY
ncbi:unnamed protein product, partial [Ectocarpus sp. 4 AP-2014]